jgi:hypothetical protein
LHGSLSTGSATKIFSVIISNLEIVNRSNSKVSLTWWRFRIAIREWISGVAVGTSAHWSVIYDSALGPEAARSWTWIATFLIHACLVAGAFWIDCAFGAAIWRTSDITGQTRARRRAAYISALRIETARRGHARISVRLLLRWRCRC